jgi:hypothetical protein
MNRSRAGKNFVYPKEPTKTTNLDGLWSLNEINNHINNTNWPKLNELPNEYNVGVAYVNYLSQGLNPNFHLGVAYINYLV